MVNMQSVCMYLHAVHLLHALAFNNLVFVVFAVLELLTSLDYIFCTRGRWYVQMVSANGKC